jgi:hypothetical protein
LHPTERAQNGFFNLRKSLGEVANLPGLEAFKENLAADSEVNERGGHNAAKNFFRFSARKLLTAKRKTFFVFLMKSNAQTRHELELSNAFPKMTRQEIEKMMNTTDNTFVRLTCWEYLQTL